MIVYFLTLSFFSFHFSPYAQVEKSFLKYNCEDTIQCWDGYAVSKSGDILSVGVTLEEDYLWTDLSFGIPWYENIEFLPYVNINSGAKWKNFIGYVGYFLPLKNEGGENSNFICSGISSFYCKNNFNIGFDIQVRKEYFSYSFPSLSMDTSYVNTIVTSKLGYVFKGYNPFLFVSLNKKSIFKSTPFRIGLGITFGSSPVATSKYERMVFHSFVRKPNIYLYPEESCSLRVLLNPDGRLTVSNPPYENGWNVYVFPDGTIHKNHRYLFYEAKINKLRVKNKGWCITKDEVSSFFFSVLSSYGFNTRETNDFVSYWKDNLPDSPYYIVYPAVNKEIDKVCPLTIYPSPDVVLRVWFVVESIETPVSMETPAIPLFKRNGFVVTEWGVILGDSRE